MKMHTHKKRVPGELMVDLGLTESVDKDVGDGGQDQDGQEEGATCDAEGEPGS